MDLLLNQIVLTLKSAWATLLDCDRTIRPIAIQCYAVLTSEAAIKRYKIIGEISVRIVEILYLLAIALVNDAQTRIDKFVSTSERKETTLPTTEEISFTFEENLWTASPVTVATDAVSTSVEAIAVPLSRPLALPAAPPKAQKQHTSRKSAPTKKSPKPKRVVTTAG